MKLRTDAYGNRQYGYESDDGYFILSREDGPAVEYLNGEFEYWLDGQLHREDGPAVFKHDFIMWFRNGVRHREDGPAIEVNSGKYGYGFYKEWWFQGEKVSVLDNEEFLRLVKLRIFW